MDRAQRRREAVARWRIRNPERKRELDTAYRTANAATLRMQHAAWRAKNRARVLATAARWRKNNPGAKAAFAAARRAKQRRATPVWADHAAIAAIYAEAAAKGMHVDHIVPLQSPVVCGLHVEYNLQLLTPAENSRKKNYYWPGMPE